MNREDYLKINLEMYQKFIKENINFTHVKVGDGEIYCMRHEAGGNIDNHPYTYDLGEKLKKVIPELSKRDNIYFPDWYYSNPAKFPHDFVNKIFLEKILKDNDVTLNYIQPFELIMMGWGNIQYPYLFEFYKSIKESIRNKIYLGPGRLKGLKDILSLNEYIEIPLINAYSSYESIFNNIKDKLVDNSIIMLSVGMMSPVLIYDMLNINPDITILDVGSGFDPLFVGQTRGQAQASMNEAKKYFENL